MAFGANPDLEAMQIAFDDSLLPEEKERKLRAIQLGSPVVESPDGINPAFGFQPENPFRAAVDTTLTPAERKARMEHNSELINMSPEERMRLNLDYMHGQAQQGRQDEMLAMGANPGAGVGGQNMGAAILPESTQVGPRRGIAGGATPPPVDPAAVAPEEPLMSLEPPPEEQAPAGAPVLPGQAGQVEEGGITPDDIARVIVNQAMQGSPGTLVKGGPRVAGSVESTTVMPEGSQEAIAESAQGLAGATQELGEEQANANIDRALKLQTLADQRKQDLEKFRKQQAETHRELEAQQTAYEQTVEEARKNPETFWNRKTTGQKVGSIVGLILMGLSGKDMSQTILNTIKEDNADADQRFERMLGAARDRMADMRARVMSPEAQQAYEESVKLQIFAHELETQALASGNPVIIKNAEIAAREILDNAQQVLIGAQKVERQTRIENVPDRVVGGRAGGPLAGVKAGQELGLKPEQTLRGIAGGEFYGDPEMKFPVRMASGQVVDAFNDTAQNKAMEAVKAYNEIQGNLNAMRQVVKEHGDGLIPRSKASDAIEMLRKKLLLGVKNAEQAGALDKGAVEVIGPMVPDPSKLLDNFDFHAQQFSSMSERSHQAAMDAYIKVRPKGGAQLGEARQ